MWKKVGMIRTRAGLTRALEAFGALQAWIDAGCPSKEIAGDYFELRSMLIAARAMAEAALFREESRGAHFRDDFPESRQEWAKSLFIRLEGAELKPFFP